MSDFAHVAQRYAEGPPRQVPGLDGLHRMTDLLLAERVPEAGRVLAEERFSADRVVPLYEQYYEQVLGAPQ